MTNTRIRPKLRLRLWVLFAVLTMSSPLRAQTAQDAARIIQNNPELVRQRIAESGLSQAEIQTRLRAAGLSGGLLDPFFDAANTSPGVSDEVLRAVDLLTVGTQAVEGLEAVPVESGAELSRAPAEAPGLSLFGVDVFRRSTTQFQPLLSGPVPDDYTVGPGDKMVLILTGDVELSHELEVTRQGFIIIPSVGQISVSNLTMRQLRQLLRQRLGRSYSGIRSGSTVFSVTISQLRTNQVFVIGEVTQPGAYQLASVATVLNALYAAGGPTDNGNLRTVEVRRDGELAGTFDLYDYLLAANTSNDITLEQGDIVFVPIRGKRVSVRGSVVRPAIYELHETETLDDVIAASGGYQPSAELQQLTISRIIPPESRLPSRPNRMLVTVPLVRGADGLQTPPFPLEAGDIVTVGAIDDSERATVEVRGAVYQPGIFGWEAGIRLSQVIERAGGFRPAIYSGMAQIDRLNQADSTRFVVRVPLPADSAEPFPDDIELSEFDVIRIFSRAEMREDRQVTISGMVNEPGMFPYRTGMTLRDLVLRARGLRDGAFLDSAVLARLPDDRSGGELATTIYVPLDSSYLFEPESSTYPLLPGEPVPTRVAPDVELMPFDHVTILKQTGFELQRLVSITGEVAFPGRYALETREQHLSSAVTQAGGPLPTAFPEGARFYRSFGDAGRVNIDLPRALANPGGDEDLILQPGDSLFIPEYEPTVRVNGAVQVPTSVLYRRGAGLDYYIAAAGGYSDEADKGKTFVQYANGDIKTKSRFLFFGSSPTPGPGSTVVVPAKPDTGGTDLVALFGSITQIVVSGITLAIVITR